VVSLVENKETERTFAPLPAGRIFIRPHAKDRFLHWLSVLGDPCPDDAVAYRRIRLLLVSSVPAPMPISTIMSRFSRHRSMAEYWRTPPWRFVILKRRWPYEVSTIEPDIYPGDAGIWEGLPGISKVVMERDVCQTRRIE
jgi:hypothetical protein